MWLQVVGATETFVTQWTLVWFVHTEDKPLIGSRIWAFDWSQIGDFERLWTTLNGVMAIILHYYAEFSSFHGQLRKSLIRRQQIFSWEMS